MRSHAGSRSARGARSRSARVRCIPRCTSSSWGADGDLGTETIDALARFLRDHGTDAADDASLVSDAELAVVQRVLAATKDAPLGPQLASGRFHDLRATASQKNIGGRRGWNQI